MILKKVEVNKEEKKIFPCYQIMCLVRIQCSQVNVTYCEVSNTTLISSYSKVQKDCFKRRITL